MFTLVKCNDDLGIVFIMTSLFISFQSIVLMRERR